jgi:hypothetical protein
MAKWGSALRLMVPPYRLNPNAELNQGLVAKYIALPGMTGGQYWYDLCGKNKGTLTNMTNGYGWQGAIGRPGGWGAMRFDGVDDYVSASVTLTGAFTFSCWFNRASAGTFGERILWGHTSSGSTYIADIKNTSVVVQGDSASAKTFAGFSIANSFWYHIAVTRDSSNNVRVFINSVESTSGAQSVTPNFTLQVIGRYAANANFWWQGYMDDIRVYNNRALSATEVAGLYEASKNQYRNEILCAYE